MARYIPVGAPVNRAEVEGLRQLRDSLPDNYIIIGNFELQPSRRRNTLEFDAVVIGDWGIWAVEIKGWSGRIRGDIRRWSLAWGRLENPFIRIEVKAKALRDLLVRRVEGWPDALFCESVVHLPSKKVDVDVADPRAERLLLRGGARQLFVERASRRREEGPCVVHLDDALKQRIVDVLVPMAQPESNVPVIPNYEIDEELEREAMPYREFVGRHRLVRSRGRVRIKAHTMDPLVPPARRDEALSRVLREMEVLHAMEGNPYMARAYELIRDMDDELIFYVVTEWVGRRTLRDWFEARARRGRGLEGMTREDWRLGWYIIDAVASMHRRGISHRNLHPEVFFLTGDAARVPFKIADLDFARMGYSDAYSERLRDIIKLGYGAPEMWLEDVHDHRVDVYSVGALLFELLVGQPLFLPGLETMRHDELWAMRRAVLPDAQSRALLDRMLAYDPDQRFSDLSDALAFFARRGGEDDRPRRHQTGEFRAL